MLVVIEKRREIDQAQTLFMKGMNKNAERSGVLIVGHLGEKKNLDTYWSKALGIWWTFSKAENRYWNAFGTEEPEWNSTHSHSITCEMNPPFEGVSHQIQGVFAKDSSGQILSSAQRQNWRR